MSNEHSFYFFLSFQSPAQFFLYDEEVSPANEENTAEDKDTTAETHNKNTAADEEHTHQQSDNTLTE